MYFKKELIASSKVYLVKALEETADKGRTIILSIFGGRNSQREERSQNFTNCCHTPSSCSFLVEGSELIPLKQGLLGMMMLMMSMMVTIRTGRCAAHSAPWFTWVPATGLAQHHSSPKVA